MVHVENVDERASRIAYYITQEPRCNPYFGPSPHCTLSLSGINFYVTSSHKFRFSSEGHLQRGRREKVGPEWTMALSLSREEEEEARGFRPPA